ncbi:unnamed protein product [Pedinophyceae sp. YPF-701]|nr:unnamed protein product [Pedinophyceae sp. YPF-701]
MQAVDGVEQGGARRTDAHEAPPGSGSAPTAGAAEAPQPARPRTWLGFFSAVFWATEEFLADCFGLNENKYEWLMRHHAYYSDADAAQAAIEEDWYRAEEEADQQAAEQGQARGDAATPDAEADRPSVQQMA